MMSAHFLQHAHNWSKFVQIDKVARPYVLNLLVLFAKFLTNCSHRFPE